MKKLILLLFLTGGGIGCGPYIKTETIHDIFLPCDKSRKKIREFCNNSEQPFKKCYDLVKSECRKIKRQNQ